MVNKIILGIIRDKDTFLDNLIWFHPPQDWENDPFCEEFIPKNQPRTLRAVVKRMMDKYGHSSEHIFDELQKVESVAGFFKGCFYLNSEFCIQKMPPILVRSIRQWEVDRNQNLCGDSVPWHDKLYIDDGNHRALVYAMQVICNESKFEYMPVFWSKSWKWLHIHGEGPQSAEQDFPPAHDGWIFNP